MFRSLPDARSSKDFCLKTIVRLVCRRGPINLGKIALTLCVRSANHLRLLTFRQAPPKSQLRQVCLRWKPSFSAFLLN